MWKLFVCLVILASVASAGRCGPPCLRATGQPVECHGIVALCGFADMGWATLSHRAVTRETTATLYGNEVRIHTGLSIIPDERSGPYFVNADGQRLLETTELAAFCLKPDICK